MAALMTSLKWLFLKCYINNLGVSGEDNPLIQLHGLLVSRARCVRAVETGQDKRVVY